MIAGIIVGIIVEMVAVACMMMTAGVIVIAWVTFLEAIGVIALAIVFLVF